MRIAIFTELYAPSIGGQEAFFAGLGHALVRRGHQVDVFCVGHELGLAAKEDLNGITVTRFPITDKYKVPLFLGMRRNWVTIFRFAFHLRSVAQTRKHDFYLLNQWPLLHALTLPRAARDRAMLHWCEIRHSPFFRIFQKFLPCCVRLNAAISDSVGEQIRRASGQPSMTLPSGVDLTRASWVNRTDRRDLVAIGRITAHKNLGMLVEAFEILKARGYAGRLKIAGAGPGLDDLRARVAASPARGEIDLLGFISDATKFALLSNSEVLAMPSKREGFPHVTSEAMSCGLPIVTADYPENGTASIVEAFGSGVVTGQNAEAFTEGITRVLSDWHHYSANGRIGVQKLDWNAIAERLETELVHALHETEPGDQKLCRDEVTVES